MFRPALLFLFSLSLFPVAGFSGTDSKIRYSQSCGQQDTIDKQVLFNGRAWRNLYSKVIGDQFLFTKEFLPGSVEIEGRSFNGLKLRYDIYNDEILTITDLGIILQLNKEMIDRFSITFDKTYEFFRNDPDSVNPVAGYLDVIYKGPVSLYVKHKKDILQLAVENKFDMFEEGNKIYLEKDGSVFLLSGKRDLLNTLGDNKKQVRSFIKTRKLIVTKRDPWSFVPVLEYYDSLQH